MCEHCGCGAPGELGHKHVHDDSQAVKGRVIRIQQDVLAHEKAHASSLRDRLKKSDARLINVIGSPGCGKTELLAVLIPRLVTKDIKCSVIEGDLATNNDAKRIKAAGAPAYQVMTGTACHLTAHDIEHGIEHLGIEPRSLIIVESLISGIAR
ncbi:MAG: hydrogenase nickel incorporation protein HypB [Deltaproteobacteria bacterium]|nr:hydrogenase nickel incorporation protein HypB [Deltaproteobacteria bacterium]